MINEEKWIKTIPSTNTGSEQKINQLDHERWINTIPKKNKNSLLKKYTFMAVLFVSGLLFVSVIKNETRNLQKEINLRHLLM